jgi:hypothetical protein
MVISKRDKIEPELCRRNFLQMLASQGWLVQKRLTRQIKAPNLWHIGCREVADLSRRGLGMT